MKKLKLLILTILLPALAVSWLGLIKLANNKSNGFKRTFLEVATIKHNASSPLLATAIIGSTMHSVFFRTKTPTTILESDLNLSKFRYLMFSVDSDIKNNAKIIVDSPSIKVFAGNSHTIFTTAMARTDSVITTLVNTPPFADGIEFSKNRFIVRAFSLNEKDYLLNKIDESGNVIKTEQNLSILKHELGLSTQSNFLYNPSTGKIFIVYRLFNSIICLDTNLNLVYRNKTVDTISTTTFSTQKASQGRHKTATYSSAPKFTNYRACLDKKNLYVYSRIKADNQGIEDAVIDVYSQSNGKYKYSFMLPGSAGLQLLDFTIKGNSLLAIYSKNNTVTTYDLNELP